MQKTLLAVALRQARSKLHKALNNVAQGTKTCLEGQLNLVQTAYGVASDVKGIDKEKKLSEPDSV